MLRAAASARLAARAGAWRWPTSLALQGPSAWRASSSAARRASKAQAKAQQETKGQDSKPARRRRKKGADAGGEAAAPPAESTRARMPPTLKKLIWAPETPPTGAPNTVYLGVDVNTDSTGFAVVDGAGAVLECGAWSTTKAHDTLGIVALLRAEMEALRARLGGGGQREWVVAVEDYLKTYRPGLFTTQGLFFLAEVNACTVLTASHVFGCAPLRLHPSVPRRLYGLAASGKDRREIKRMVLDFVVQRKLPAGFALSQNRMKRTHASNYDMADAVLLALAALHESRVAVLRGSTGFFREFARRLVAEHGGQLSLSKADVDAALRDASRNGGAANGADAKYESRGSALLHRAFEHHVSLLAPP
jgi:hypothetical protein